MPKETRMGTGPKLFEANHPNPVMAEFKIKYIKGPRLGEMAPRELKIGQDRYMSFGHGEQRSFRLDKTGDVAETHANIKNKGTAEKPELVLMPKEGKTTVWIPGTRYYTALSAQGAPLVHGMRIRIGDHYFEVEASKTTPTTPATKPPSSPKTTPTNPPSQKSTIRQIGTAMVAGVKAIWSAGKVKKEPVRVLFQVTTEDRARKGIPRPVIAGSSQRHGKVLERVVNYALQHANKIANERRLRAHEALLKRPSSSRKKSSEQAHYDEMVASQSRIGHPAFFEPNLHPFLSRLDLRDPANPSRTRKPTHEELEFGTKVVTRNLLGKDVVDLAAIPKIHEGKLVGHEVHVMLPQLIKSGQRIAKQLARFYKHDVHLVAYPFAKK